jgi:glutamyl-tRNA synthetase
MSSALVVTRFAPSPSGALHLGNARTALFSWLLARRHGGRFLLRIEDSDAGRSLDAHVASLAADLRWLGLDWELGPGSGAAPAEWRQSARRAIYAAQLERLAADGNAYPCYCTAAELEQSRREQLAAGRPPRYAGTCRSLSAAAQAAHLAAGRRAAWRFRVPRGQRVQFDDLVHGAQSCASDELGDFILQREDGTAAFFFCNAIDDALMHVTHVLRGEDHLANTPRQLLILQALSLPAPQYGHVALLTAADGVPLAKRHGATSLSDFRARGYAPLALCNLLFRLGHSTADHALLGLEAMAQGFDLGHLQRAPARFDAVQLRHWQSLWVRSLAPEQAEAWLQEALGGVPPGRRAAFLAAVLPNVTLPEDARAWADALFGAELRPEADAARAIALAGPAFFAAAAAAIGDGADLNALRAATGAKGAGLFAPLRAALTGRLHGPELAALLALLPAATVRARLRRYAEGA